VTRRLKVINEKLEGLGCTDAELPDLLRQLDGDLLRDLDAQADAAETSESASVQPKAMKFKPSKSVSKAGATVPTVTQGTITQVTISTAQCVAHRAKPSTPSLQTPRRKSASSTCMRALKRLPPVEGQQVSRHCCCIGEPGTQPGGVRRS